MRSGTRERPRARTVASLREKGEIIGSPQAGFSVGWRLTGWLVSFNGLPFFNSYPNLAAAQILNPAGGDNVLLMRDIKNPSALLGDFGSQLTERNYLDIKLEKPRKKNQS